MDENSVPGLHARRGKVAPVCDTPSDVVSCHQINEGRLLLWSLVFTRIDMVDPSPRIRLRFGSGTYRDYVLCFPFYTIRIRYDKPALVLGVGPKIKYASRKKIWSYIVDPVVRCTIRRYCPKIVSFFSGSERIDAFFILNPKKR